MTQDDLDRARDEVISLLVSALVESYALRIAAEREVEAPEPD